MTKKTTKNCEMPIADCGLQNAESGTRDAECGMQNAESGTQNAECGRVPPADQESGTGVPPVDSGDDVHSVHPVHPVPLVHDVHFVHPSPEEPEAELSEIEEEDAFIEDMPEAETFRTPDELKSAVECLLFTTPHPLSLARLKTILGNVDMRTLRGAVTQLQTEYDARANGLQIVESAEGYLMCTRPEFANAILRLHRQRKRNPLTVTALETLAIVAYKQPITRAEIEMIRGVESSGVLRNLCDMGLVKVVGRKEVIGRPQLYGTTSVFLRTFGLKSLDELPTIQALRRRYGTKTALVPAAGEQPNAEAAENAEARGEGNEETDQRGEGERQIDADPGDVSPTS